ncbi:MAG: methyltransferase domain-containing protein [Streptosporangiaceae bacterium]
MQRCKQIADAQLGLRPGQAVLDAGCGCGADAADMAALVGPAGRAVGIDASGAMIIAARQRFAGTGLPHLRDRRVCGPRFPDATFSACRAERLLQHVPDPGRAVCEVARVARPGGRVPSSSSNSAI